MDEELIKVKPEISAESTGRFSIYSANMVYERFSLTPALSRRERENYSPMVCNDGRTSRFIVPM
jgi:hypothetical protein